MAQAATSLERNVQSAGQSGSLEELALIEHQIDPGLIELLENYQPLEKLADIPADRLDDRFTISLDTQLPDFATSCAEAYAAKDNVSNERPLMGLVVSSNYPLRQFAIDALIGVQHPCLLTLRGAGKVKLSSTKELKEVLFLDQPPGMRISDILAQGKRFHERQVIDLILTPIIDAMALLAEKSISHGKINIDNVYFDRHAVLGDFLSEPAGLTQNYLFEPLERLLAADEAKGEATPKCDSYALGILAYCTLFGIDAIKNVGRDNLIHLLLEKGIYHSFLINSDFSEALTDFFRGCLTENKQERWGMEQLKSWIGGKRFNLIMPSPPKESTRPYSFSEYDYFNRRALANGIYNSWGVADAQIRGGKLDRWLQMSAHDPETADQIDTIIRLAGGEHGGGNERAGNEMISRVITALDPFGPIRLKSLSVHVDGIGMSFVKNFKENDNARLRLLFQIIEMDLPNNWSETSPMEKTAKTGQVLWALQRMRNYINWKHYGYGLERIIYDLNPSLPCQCPWLMPYYAMELSDTLNILDNVAKSKAQTTSLADRHLTAFLASKFELSREIKFNQLEKVPKLKNHPELIAMRILSMAQDKSGQKKLIGLATWAAIRVDKIMDQIHSRKLRNKIRENLKLAAKSGSVSRVLAVVVENNMTQEDHIGFSRANLVYLRNQARIDALKNNETLDKMSQDYGGRIAVFIAYMILCITFYTVLDTYLL